MPNLIKNLSSKSDSVCVKVIDEIKFASNLHVSPIIHHIYSSKTNYLVMWRLLPSSFQLLVLVRIEVPRSNYFMFT